MFQPVDQENLAKTGIAQTVSFHAQNAYQRPQHAQNVVVNTVLSIMSAEKIVLKIWFLLKMYASRVHQIVQHARTFNQNVHLALMG